jgi:hypothetical protein
MSSNVYDLNRLIAPEKVRNSETWKSPPVLGSSAASKSTSFLPARRTRRVGSCLKQYREQYGEESEEQYGQQYREQYRPNRLPIRWPSDSRGEANQFGTFEDLLSRCTAESG